MPTPLCNKNTDWEYFKKQLESKLSPNIRIKTKKDLDTAIEFLTTSIQDAAWGVTPTKSTIHKLPDCPISVKKAIAEKRKTRKKWQLTRDPKIKTQLNRKTKDLKNLLNKLKNESIQNYLKNLTATEATDYNLWKATRSLKQPKQHVPPIRKSDGSWARNDKDKAVTFATHLDKVFQPLAAKIIPAEEEYIH